jgi:hypothetical protein
MAAPTRAILNNTVPGEYAAAVVKSDVTVFTPNPRALYIGTGGDLTVAMPDGDIVLFKGVPGGTILPVRVSQVRAATVAADIVALY